MCVAGFRHSSIHQSEQAVEDYFVAIHVEPSKSSKDLVLKTLSHISDRPNLTVQD